MFIFFSKVLNAFLLHQFSSYTQCIVLLKTLYTSGKQSWHLKLFQCFQNKILVIVHVIVNIQSVYMSKIAVLLSGSLRK